MLLEVNRDSIMRGPGANEKGLCEAILYSHGEEVLWGECQAGRAETQGPERRGSGVMVGNSECRGEALTREGTPHSREGYTWGRKTHRINNRDGCDETSAEDRRPGVLREGKQGMTGVLGTRCWLAGGPGSTLPSRCEHGVAGRGLVYTDTGGRRGLSSGGRAAAVGSTGDRGQMWGGQGPGRRGMDGERRWGSSQ